ncbi:MAG: HAD family phosphatase [Lachnospiraceae bacterium]|nr:HAD family phosphatase [Lachnospiraceae bacterium]
MRYRLSILVMNKDIFSMIDDILSKIAPYIEDKKCVILDMDGTILDSMGMWHELDIVYLRSMGEVATPEFCEAVKTMTIYEAADYMAELFNTDKTGEVIAQEILDMSADLYRKEIPLKERSAEFMQYLYEQGKSIIIATSNEEDLTRAALERNNVMQYVSGIMTSTMAGRSKEYPDVYIKAGEFADASIEECVVFEDAMYAVKTAKEAGFTVVAVYDDGEKDNWDRIVGLSDSQVVLDNADKL